MIAAEAISQARTAEKRFSTLQAQLAIKGYTLRRIEGGPLLIGKWGMVREVRDLDAVEQFARQVGAA